MFPQNLHPDLHIQFRIFPPPPPPAQIKHNNILGILQAIQKSRLNRSEYLQAIWRILFDTDSSEFFAFVSQSYCDSAQAPDLKELIIE
jgi:hypothetical protein